jgi:HEAT repeats
VKSMLIAVALLSAPTEPVLQPAQTPKQETRPTVDPELREMALRAIIQQADTPKLVAMYDAEKNQEFRELILRHIAQHDDQQARQKLTAVAKQDPDPEMREVAIRHIAQRSDTAALVELYDTQKDTEIKEVVIRQLGQRSDVPSRQKLIAIVKSETDEDLQTTAVRALGQRATTQELIDLFDGVRDAEVREALIRELARRRDELARNKLLAIVEGK